MKLTKRINSVKYDFSKHAMCDSVGNVIASFNEDTDTEIAIEICDSVEFSRDISKNYHLQPSQFEEPMKELETCNGLIIDLEEEIECLKSEIDKLKKS